MSFCTSSVTPLNTTFLFTLPKKRCTEVPCKPKNTTRFLVFYGIFTVFFEAKPGGACILSSLSPSHQGGNILVNGRMQKSVPKLFPYTTLSNNEPILQKKTKSCLQDTPVLCALWVPFVHRTCLLTGRKNPFKDVCMRERHIHLSSFLFMTKHKRGLGSSY